MAPISMLARAKPQCQNGRLIVLDVVLRTDQHQELHALLRFPRRLGPAIALTPGGSLTAAIPGQVRPATQYLTGWTRDFVTVVAPGTPG